MGDSNVSYINHTNLVPSQLLIYSLFCAKCHVSRSEVTSVATINQPNPIYSSQVSLHNKPYDVIGYACMYIL